MIMDRVVAKVDHGGVDADEADRREITRVEK